eukprot:706290-Pyramimonas_sp.AAC.1
MAMLKSRPRGVSEVQPKGACGVSLGAAPQVVAVLAAAAAAVLAAADVGWPPGGALRQALQVKVGTAPLGHSGWSPGSPSAGL